MSTEIEEIRITVRELVKKSAQLEERVETLTKFIKNHEHDSRDGGAKFDMAYL
jgi:hypothetical protein